MIVMERIQLIHPLGKKAVSMPIAKYEPLKDALINFLKKKGTATHKEIGKAVIENFKKNKTPFEGAVLWHLEWVKLDLEAHKIIKRIEGTSPQQYALIK